MDMPGPTLNAKVAAIALLLGAATLHLTNQLDQALVPIRLLTLGVLVMGAWAFSDEMGIRKPLVRAAFICFVFSMAALAVMILEPHGPDIAKYGLLYAMTLLLAVLIWSAAFLHRQKNLKIVGTLGAVASLLPIVVIIAGHASVGAAAWFGVTTLLYPDGESTLLGSAPVNVVESVFLVWCLAAAVFLLKGQVVGSLP